MQSPRAGPIKDGKVIVHFRHTGGAPILKQCKYKVQADARFATIIQLLRSHLRLGNEEPLVREFDGAPRRLGARTHRPIALQLTVTHAL